MRSTCPLRLALLILAALLPRQAAAAPDLLVRRLHIDITLTADGTASTIVQRDQTALDAPVAAAISRYAIPFNAAREHVTVLQAQLQKRNGGRIDLLPASQSERAAPGLPPVSPFQTLRQIVLGFPGVTAGDTETMRWQRDHEAPLIPGQFMRAIALAELAPTGDAVITLTAPATMKLRLEAHGLDATQSAVGDQIRYVWRLATGEDTLPNALSRWDEAPRLFISTLPDYRALADAYQQAAAAAQAVTPALQARADAITAGLTTPAAQAQALYDWVTLRIRSFPLDFGANGFAPQPAEATLRRGFGDSADGAALLAALLRARGIDSRAVLVNLDTAYTLSTPPTLAQLNHVLLWLPALNLYADPSNGVAPFGTLPFQAYGKPAVVAGEGQRAIPVLAADAASIATTTEAHMDLDGAVLGTSTTLATGPAAIALRLATQLDHISRGEAVSNVLAENDEQGDGNFQQAPTDSSGGSFTVSGRFRLESHPALLDGERFTPPVGLQLLVRPGDFFLGPLHRPDLAAAPATSCYAGRQTEDLSLQLPEGHSPDTLPPDANVTMPEISYRSHWSQHGQMLHIHREMISRITAPLCSGPLRQEATAAQKIIRRDEEAMIRLGGP